MSIFKRVRISRLFFGAFAIVVAVITLATSLIGYSIAAQELARNTTVYQQALLGELNKQLYIQLGSLEQMSLSALRNIEIISYNSRQNPYEQRQSHRNLENSLASITYSATIVHSIYLYVEQPVPDSQLLSVQFHDIGPLAEQDWFSLPENREFAWLPEHVIQANTGALPVIGFARKVRNAGLYNGIMIFNIKVSDIQKLISGGEEKARSLFDPQGRLITAVREPEQGGWDIPDTVPAEEQAQGRSSTMRKDLLLVWDTIPSGWTLMEATPWQVITQGSRRLSLSLLLVGIAGIAAASAVILFLSKQLTKPLRQLVGLMDRYPAESDTLFPQDYTNEFGSLFEGYGSLLERNRELMESLREQYRLQKETEIKALQAMINPHFLYNTLDQINWMAIDAGEARISEALSLMGKMFRIGLSHGEPLIPLGQELIHVEYYLRLQRLRWQERLTYTIDADPALEGCLVPRLILQPFVENSILHGFHRRNRGTIGLTVRGEGGDIVITIADDGVGIPPDWRERKRKGGGYGLQNVLRRIEVQQGSCGVQIAGEPDKGTRVVIRLAQR